MAYFPVCNILGTILGKGHHREKGLMPATHAHSQQLGAAQTLKNTFLWLLCTFYTFQLKMLVFYIHKKYVCVYIYYIYIHVCIHLYMHY